jgi:ribonuclease P protein component
VRRRLRQVFHASLDEVPGSWDLVVSARPEAAGAGLDELNQEFARSLRRLAESGKLGEAGTR